MGASEFTAKLCGVCSKLDTQRLVYPLYPCRDPLPCSTPPVKQFGRYLALGSIDEIKSRRLTCDICGLIANSLDKEPADINGECRITESAEFCNFKLPTYVEAQDPGVTHFHLTQAAVIFDPSKADRFQGPSLPWELKERDIQSSHYILNFQAKARSRAETGDLANSPKTREEFLDTIGGRYVSREINAELIRAWLHQCESEHGEDCIPSSRLRGGPYKVPTFVVDVHQSCIVNTPPECRYVALSYVWGSDSVFMHLLENSQGLLKTGSLCSLPIPDTIQDSMTLVHSIGERYLWVDSLCIVQDDDNMKNPEIKRMGSIYSKALFTIIAAAGDNANSGLPGVKQESREDVQKSLKLANCELLTVIDVRKTPNGIDGTTWAQRAWTFQERALSNRMLVFSKDQVYWSCRVATHSEERALENARGIDQLRLSFPQTFAADSLPWKPLEPLGYCRAYEELLSNYRQRYLSHKTDLVNAFSGVAEILAAFQNDTFFWGLPASLFSYALTWFFTGHSKRNDVEVPVVDSNGSKQTVPFPSWSWAAWSGEKPNDLPFLHAGDSTHVRPVIHFDIVDTEHKLVRIKEQSWEGHPSDNSVRALWRKEEPHQCLSLTPRALSRVGHLYFWTSFATVKAIRRWRFQGPGQVEYILFPPPDFQPDAKSTHYRSEIVDQDFVVVAAGGPETLILLAIEWKGDTAYRVGKTQVQEAEWVRVENRQWRLITLG